MNKLLQQSSLLSTRACIILFIVFSSYRCQMCAILLIIINKALVNLFTCMPDFNSLSRWNPRSLTDITLFISSSLIFMEVMHASDISRFLFVPSIMNYVLLPFNCNVFVLIHIQMSPIHFSRFSMLCSLLLVLVGVYLRYSC